MGVVKRTLFVVSMSILILIWSRERWCRLLRRWGVIGIAWMFGRDGCGTWPRRKGGWRSVGASCGDDCVSLCLSLIESVRWVNGREILKSICNEIDKR